MKKEIIKDYDKEWDRNMGKTICPICNSNIEILTSTGWWNFYFKCYNCNKLFIYSHGDKMGGQPDGIFEATYDELEKDLNDERYGHEFKK